MEPTRTQKFEYYPNGGSILRIVVATLALTVGTAIVISGGERHKIMEQWGDRRCDFMTMMSGFLYKPDSYMGSATDFAVDNFNFCVGSIAKKTLKVGTIPVLNLMKQQANAQGTVLNAQNGIRTSLASTTDKVKTKLNVFYDKYKQVIHLFSRISQGVSSAFNRIMAMLISLIYMLISAYAAVLNTIEMTGTAVVIVAAIAMAAAIGMMFFSPWIGIPLLAISTTGLTLATLTKIQMNNIFCFARGTPIMTATGTTPIERLEIGQTLVDGGVVEGMFTFNGLDTELYVLNGILVSGSHLVYGPNGVCSVENHPDARLTTTRTNLLYCPIISSRAVYTPSNSSSQPTKFADWEEVSGEAEDEYDKEVRYMLRFTNPLKGCSLPSGLRGHASVITDTDGIVLLSGVKIGSRVLDADDNYVEVLGVCRRTVNVANTGSIFTDGVIHYDFDDRSWKYLDADKTTGSGENEVDVYQLITSSGSYAVIKEDGSGSYTVRDATEVGMSRIDMLTPLVLKHLNLEYVKL
jgi:hypothetical protein